MAASEEKKQYYREWYQRNKESRIAKAAEWKKANPEKVSASSAKRYRKKKEHILAVNREWQSKNKDRINERIRERRAENPEPFRLYLNGRRRKEKDATPPWVDRKEIVGFYEMAQRLTKCTGVKHHVDHIYPIKGENSCGLHVPYNLQVIPAHINIKKSNKLPTGDIPYVR